MSKFSNVVLTLSLNPFEYIEKILDPIENLNYKKVIMERLHLTHIIYRKNHQLCLCIYV
jgi:hypothetical protein